MTKKGLHCTHNGKKMPKYGGKTKPATVLFSIYGQL